MSTNVTINGIMVDYTNYIWVWGRQPRGTGNWAFFLGNESDPRHYEGTFASARKQAVRDAKAAGYWKVAVGS